MSTVEVRSALQSYSWLAVAAATVSVYAWGPWWPHAMAPLPLWPLLPLFALATSLIALWLSRQGPSFIAVLLGGGGLAIYLYAELLIYDLASAASQGRLIKVVSQYSYALIAVPLFNVLVKLPAIAVFSALEFGIIGFGRFGRPGAREGSVRG